MIGYLYKGSPDVYLPSKHDGSIPEPISVHSKHVVPLSPQFIAVFSLFWPFFDISRPPQALKICTQLLDTSMKNI